MKLIKLFRHYRNTYPHYQSMGSSTRKDWILKKKNQDGKQALFQAYPYAVVDQKNTLWI